MAYPWMTHDWQTIVIVMEKLGTPIWDGREQLRLLPLKGMAFLAGLRGTSFCDLGTFRPLGIRGITSRLCRVEHEHYIALESREVLCVPTCGTV
jgi:hypothetical protein